MAYWVRYGLILRMLNSAKRQDLETEAMWSVKVSWSSIMTPRFLAVLDGRAEAGLQGSRAETQRQHMRLE